MTTPGTYRRDRLSLWDTALMLRAAGRDAQSLAPLLLLVVCVVAAPPFGVLLLTRDPSPSDRFFVITGLLIPLAATVTVLFEVRRIAALAFLRTIPQPHAPRSLLLLPTCGLGVLAGLLSLSVLPVLAAVALLGCWCWAAAIGHRFAGRSGWVLLLGAVPLAYIALFAAAVSFGAAGLAGMAAVSAALALVGCLASPRDRFVALATGATRPQDGRIGRGAPEIPIGGDRRAQLRRPTAGVFQIALRAGPRASAGTYCFALATAAVCFVPSVVSSPMRGLGITVGFQMVVANGLAAANSRATREFFATRPLSRWALLRWTVVPWLLLGLYFPTVALVRATTLTTAAPGDLVHRVLRLALVQQAYLFAWAALAIADTRKNRTRIRLTCGALFVAAGALMMPAVFPWLNLAWQLPPVWLGGSLAAAGAYLLWGRLAIPG